MVALLGPTEPSAKEKLVRGSLEVCARGVIGDRLNVYPRLMKGISAPALVMDLIKPEGIFYPVVKGSTSARWMIEMKILIGEVTDSAQDQAWELISPDSALILALRRLKFAGKGACTPVRSTITREWVGAARMVCAPITVKIYA